MMFIFRFLSILDSTIVSVSSEAKCVRWIWLDTVAAVSISLVAFDRKGAVVEENDADSVPKISIFVEEGAMFANGI
jgi:hypothetical protein